MNSWRALFAAVGSSGLLPWLLAAALAACGAVGSAGFYAGHHWAASACETEKAASAVAALQHQAKAVAQAQGTSDRIWAIGLALNVDLSAGRERAAARTKEVIRYVDASPDLARCVVPASVQRVRDEQVRDSESAAAPGDTVRR